MKLRTSRSLLEKKPRIEIIPMIDVIFFLLVFFMISSLANQRLNTLSLHLPKTPDLGQAAALPRHLHNTTLSLNEQGVVWINQTPVLWPELERALALALQKQTEDTLVIRADTQVPYGRVVEAMGLARKIGFKKFSLSTEVLKP